MALHYLGLAACETRLFFILPTFVFAAGFARFAFCANWFGVVALALFVARNLVRVLLHGENSRSFCDFLIGRSRRLCRSTVWHTSVNVRFWDGFASIPGTVQLLAASALDLLVNALAAFQHLADAALDLLDLVDASATPVVNLVPSTLDLFVDASTAPVVNLANAALDLLVDAPAAPIVNLAASALDLLVDAFASIPFLVASALDLLGDALASIPFLVASATVRTRLEHRVDAFASIPYLVASATFRTRLGDALASIPFLASWAIADT